MRSYRVEGDYLRDKTSQAYVACLLPDATPHDRAAIKAAPRLLAVLMMVRDESVHSDGVFRILDEAIKAATPCS